MKYLGVLSLLCIALLVSGCSESEHPDVQATPTISFWHFWSDPASKKVLSELVEEFERRNNCDVQMTELSWGDGKTKLFAAFSSNTAPDVLELGSDWVAQFSHQGVLTNLGAAETVLAPYQAFSQAPAVYEGSAYALPWVVDTRVMYMNTVKAGEQPPTTIDEMIALAGTMHSDGSAGIGVNGPDAHRLYKKVLPFVWAHGGELLGNNNVPHFNSPAVVAGVQQYVDLMKVGEMNTQRELDASFVQGSVGMWMSGSWLIPKLAEADSSKVTAKAFLMPGVSGPGVSFAGGEYLALSAASEQPVLARSFIEYMTQVEQALKFCKQVSAAGFPADKNGLENNWYQDIPYKQVFAEQLQHSQMTPVHPQWLEMEKIFESAVESVLLGTSTTQEALDVAQRQTERLLKE